MSIEEFKEGVESREDIEIVREEIRGALLADACLFDEDGRCEKKWFEEYVENGKFDKFFDDFASKNKDVLELWVTNRKQITSLFHEELNDLDIKKDLAA